MYKPKFKIGDKVRILDGSEIKDYTGGFPSGMARLVGKIATVRSVEPWPGGRIAYLLEGVKDVGGYSWDERGLEKALRTKDGADQKIVIYRYGQSVIAKDYSTGKTAEAKCNPVDEFDFHKGAALAFDRLFDREEPKPEEPKPEEPKYYTGKVVCVERGPGKFGSLDVIGSYWWTFGKVYDVVNGMIRDDDGDPRYGIKTLEELNEREDKYAKFIALADPKPEEPKYFTGKVVCVKKGPGMAGEANVSWWTVGKVYDVVAGVIRDDDGSTRRPAESLTELNEITRNYAEFIALVE